METPEEQYIDAEDKKDYTKPSVEKQGEVYEVGMGY